MIKALRCARILHCQLLLIRRTIKLEYLEIIKTGSKTTKSFGRYIFGRQYNTLTVL